jgi:hypothetical protein
LTHTIDFGRDIALTLSWDDLPPTVVNPDAPVASGTLEVTLRPTGGYVRATREIEVGVDALVRFDNELSALLGDLTGATTLEPWLDLDGLGDFALTVRLSHGKGTLSGFLATSSHEARLTFDGVEIDQAYLAETQRQLRLLLDHRPG